MGKSYPNDISREQFETIRPLLESDRRKTSPRRVELYEVFCAVLYLLRSGSQWRMLPEEFPKWRTVQIVKRRELHQFAVIPKRWVVERSFALLDKNRSTEHRRGQCR